MILHRRTQVSWVTLDGQSAPRRVLADSTRLTGNGMTAQPKPVPLIPQQGFLGSYQGLKSLENAFYPMLIGALGLIVLFDYGT
jgi:hypothetical protein